MKMNWTMVAVTRRMTRSLGRVGVVRRREYSVNSSSSIKNREVSLYVHWPYCESKCTYCNFNKYVNPPTLDLPSYERAYLADLSYSLRPYHGAKLHSVYFGGGTPTLAPPSLFAKILKYLQEYCQLSEGTEITIEGNPTSVERDSLHAFKSIGINRVSLGIQALNNRDLKSLGRDHSFEDGLRALELANQLFDNTTMDLIFGRPLQTLESWQNELKLGLDHVQQHLSLYQLMIEPGTPYYKLYQKDQLPIPETTILEDMYQFNIEYLTSRGFNHYEVSSFGKDGWIGHHNMSYWRGVDYIGIGPGAHGRVTTPLTQSKLRTYRILAPSRWLQSCHQYGHGIHKVEPLSPLDSAKERVVLGLRTRQGLNLKSLLPLVPTATNDQDPIATLLHLPTLHRYHRSGHLILTGQLPDDTILAPTEKGLAVIDSILVDLLL